MANFLFEKKHNPFFIDKINRKHIRIYIRHLMMVSFLLVFIFYQIVLPVEAWDGERIFYTALGDSIAKGYSADDEAIENYSQLISGRLYSNTGIPVISDNFAKNGLTTKGLNHKILSDEVAIESLKRADIITVTIGANDLLNEFKKVAQEILKTDRKFRSADDALEALQEGFEANPLIIVSVVKALSNWDYESFEEEWIAAQDTIKDCKKETAQVVVTNIYNPVGAMELPGTLNAVVESVIKNMNEIMAAHAKEYHYQVIDLFESEVSGNTQSDGLHPNQSGQDMIASMIYDSVQSTEDARIAVIDKEKEEAAQKAMKEKQKAAMKQAKKKRIKVAVISCGILAVLLVICIIIKWKYQIQRTKKI